MLFRSLSTEVTLQCGITRSHHTVENKIIKISRSNFKEGPSLETLLVASRNDRSPAGLAIFRIEKYERKSEHLGTKKKTFSSPCLPHYQTLVGGCGT